MNRHGNLTLQSVRQNQVESEFMSAPNIPLSESYAADLQTREYNFPIGYNPPIADDWSSNLLFAADPYLSWLDDGDQQLEEIRQEAEEACTPDSEIDPVPDSAYDDAYRLLYMLFHWGVPMPDIGWLTDGGIGFEWWSRNRKGIGTMSIYGDNHVIYGASVGDARRIKGTCTLSNLASLDHFRTMLLILCSQ